MKKRPPAPHVARAQAADLRTSAVRAVLRQINEEVDHLPSASLRLIAPVLHAAEAELASALHEVFAVDAAETFTAQRYRVALIQIREALGAVRKVAPEMVHALGEGHRRAGLLAQTHLIREAAFFSQHFGASVTAIPILPALKLASRAQLHSFQKSAKGFTAGVEMDIRRQLAIGMIRKESFGEMGKRLVRVGGPRGKAWLGAIEDGPQPYAADMAEGLFDRYESWSRTRVRTDVIGAYNQVQADQIDALAKDDPDVQKRWDAELDRMVCDDCEELDGETIETDEEFESEDGDKVDAPPLHPSCRCALVLWSRQWPAVTDQPATQSSDEEEAA